MLVLSLLLSLNEDLLHGSQQYNHNSLLDPLHHDSLHLPLHHSRTHCLDCSVDLTHCLFRMAFSPLPSLRRGMYTNSYHRALKGDSLCRGRWIASRQQQAYVDEVIRTSVAR